jgi:hypothetical protein
LRQGNIKLLVASFEVLFSRPAEVSVAMGDRKKKKMFTFQTWKK